ncbi:MAG: ABC transporter permease subunit [Eubacteriales bacterium]|nr:ABC transporter permease subunit [Eubacteriales bacterium]
MGYRLHVYDELNRPYERKNLYLRELAEIDEALAEKRGDAAELKARRHELIKQKKDHPYIQKLAAAKAAEQQKLKEIRAKKQSFKATDYHSKTLARWAYELYEAKEHEKFYKPLRELSYDFELAYLAATTKLSRLPAMIAHQEDLEVQKEALEEALAKAKKEPREPIAQAIAKRIEELKATSEAERKKIKELHRTRQISTKAYKNKLGQIKRAESEEVSTAKSTLDPVFRLSDQLKNIRHHIKTDPQAKERVLQSDISDIRRRSPVETELTSPWRAYVTAPLPGLGQLLNKQYYKAAFFFLLSLLVYGINIPYVFGKHNYRGDGLAGLIGLAAGKSRVDRSIIFMIEGILALFLLIFAIVILYLSFRDVLKVERDKIKGVRPYNYFETKKLISRKGFPYIVSLPALVLIVFIVMVPIMSTILISFTNYDPQHQSKFVWTGIANYKEIFLGRGVAGGPFWHILGWTLLWTAGATTLAIAVGFFLSLLVHQDRVRGKKIFRTIYLLPWAVPAFITIMMFSIMFSPGGPLADILESILGYPFNVKNSTSATRVVLILLQTWLGSAYVFMLSTGVLQGISSDLYEAAHIDGASPFQQVTKITIPLVLYRTAPLLIGQYTFNFNNFSIIHLFNGGGPFNPAKYGNIAGSSDLLISYIYKLTIVKNYQAIGAAITIVVSLFLLLFTWIGYKNSKAFKEN